MVVAGEDKNSSTMLWVQASAATLHQIHPSVPEGEEWFYIPRPSLSLPLQGSAGRTSEGGSRISAGTNSSTGRVSRGAQKSQSLAIVPSTLQPSVHVTGTTTRSISSAVSSSASSQVSGSSGQLLVESRPSWIPVHPPPLRSKDSFSKKDPELGHQRSSRDDEDNISLASSTHFTVIGGSGGGGGGRKGGGCCSHSHRLTALVLTMSLVFLAGITAAVILLEMRHRR